MWPYKLIASQVRKPSGTIGKMIGYGMARGHRRLYDWTIDLMDVRPTDRVLDVGCGNGKVVGLIAGISTEGFVAGIDYSEAMVQSARKLNADEIRSGRVEIVHSNVSAMLYEDESFDKVCAIETFYFWPDPALNLKEVWRVLKPGGSVFVVMEMSKEITNQQKAALWAARFDLRCFSEAEMEEMLTEAGFGRTWFKTARENEWGWICAVGVR